MKVKMRYVKERIMGTVGGLITAALIGAAIWTSTAGVSERLMLAGVLTGVFFTFLAGIWSVDG